MSGRINNLNEYEFRAALDRASKKVKTILDTSRNPKLPKDVAHAYEDKFALAEICVKSAIAAQLNHLDVLGMTKSHHETIRAWVEKGQAVTLRFEVEETCAFDREVKREVESSTKYVKETESLLGTGKTTETHKVITTVTDYFWNFKCAWKILAYAGSNPKNSPIVLREREYKHEIKTTSKIAPRPKRYIPSPEEVNVTWLFKNYDTSSKGYKFRIDRTDPKKCMTPRRNPDVENAMSFFVRLASWSTRVTSTLNRNGTSFVETGKQIQSQILTSHAFDVVAAVFAFEKKEDSKISVLYSSKDYAMFMSEHERSLRESLDKIKKLCDNATPYSDSEGTVGFVSRQMNQLSNTICDAINKIERYILDQVVAAIGKEVQPADFAEYMDYHYSRLFREEYRPRPFCFSIRRPNRFPQGSVSVEASSSSSSRTTTWNPIRTSVMKAPSTTMSFPLNAATSVRFKGDRFVHASVFHRFSGDMSSKLRLVARARQFSSFVILIGKIADAKTFAPESAMIVKDKDDLKIPLMLDTLPTAKEFKDAVESLSPEQQRFCKAFRSMQLASSVFAVLTIEIKPQMEKVLNLPSGALTKEIALTQGLSDLFIEYQISPDLLSFEGNNSSTSPSQRLQSVQQHYDAIRKVIDKEKQLEIEEAKKRAAKEAALEIARREAEERMRAMKKRVKERSVRSTRTSPPRPSRSMMLSESCAMSAPVMCRPSPPPQKNMLKRKHRKKGGRGNVTKPPAPPATQTKNNNTSAQRDVSTKQQDDGDDSRSSMSGLDFTKLPGMLDKNYEKLDVDNALRPTIIKHDKVWSHEFQRGLLSKPETRVMNQNDLNKSKNAAYDLLDALTRSGAIEIDSATFHVVIASTHCFDRTLMNSIVMDNMNPIEKVERSQLIMNMTIRNKTVQELVEDVHIPRLTKFSPLLLKDE